MGEATVRTVEFVVRGTGVVVSIPEASLPALGLGDELTLTLVKARSNADASGWMTPIECADILVAMWDGQTPKTASWLICHHAGRDFGDNGKRGKARRINPAEFMRWAKSHRRTRREEEDDDAEIQARIAKERERKKLGRSSLA